MRFSLLFFPGVGVVIAALLYLLYIFFTFWNLSSVFFSAAAVFSVIVFTGGLHLDGYCDTVDALCSRQEREQKLKILKDVHLGAFAVVYTIALLLLQFGAWHQLFLKPHCLGMVLISFIISRSLGALALVSFPAAKKEGLGYTFRNQASQRIIKIVLVCYLLLCFTVLFYIAVLPATVIILALLISYLWFYRLSKKHFGGLTGDLTGFYLVVCETLILVLGAVIGGLIT
ncbi:MAG: adenosylcobinamide-GDP ribazoletransferase [Desulfitobacteriia bacterium]